jgi:plasmid segregation protein ParM
MKSTSKTIIIGIDHGYGNIKTANTVTPTGIIAYDSKPTFEGNILFYKDVFYRIGEGHKAFVQDKVKDNDFYVLTLAAIARELNQMGVTDANIHIAAGVPLTWVRTQRESFREYLMQNEVAEFIFRDRKFNVRFVGCSIFPQCYPAILEKLKYMNDVNIVADIGNGTMNVMYIRNRKPVESQCYTEKLGVNQFVIAAQNAVMDKFGTKIDDSIIQSVIRRGTANIGKEYLGCITAAAKNYAEGIFTALKKYEYNSELMPLYIVGGGGCIIKHFGEYDKERVFINDDVRATANGYEKLAESMMKKKAGEVGGET